MVKYIEPKDLAERLRNDNEKVLVVDVRDSDYEVKRVIANLTLTNSRWQRLEEA